MSRRQSGSGRAVLTALLLSLLCVAVLSPAARADLGPATVTAGGAADPATGALVLSPAENPAGLGKLPAPVRGKPLFPRRPGGLLQAGLDMATAASNRVAQGPLAQTLAAAHLDLARVPGVWAYVEPKPDQYDWTSLDESYRAVIKAGMRPVIQLLASPGWAIGYRGGARDDGCNGQFCMQPPSTTEYPYWARFSGAVARRYPLAAAIEIWNEPNLWSFWHAGGVDPAAYEALLATSYNAIKAANPAMRVLGGSINNLFTTRQQTQRDCVGVGVIKAGDCLAKYDVGYAEFLRSMLQDGAADKMDGLSLHPYPINRTGLGLTGTFSDTQDILTAAGAPWMRLVPSEVGVDAPSTQWPDDQSQAESTLAIYNALSGVPAGLVVPSVSHVDAVLFFESVEVGRGFGWLTQTSRGALNPRPVYCLMADRLGSRPPQCPGRELFTDSILQAVKKVKAKAKAKAKRKSSKHKRADVATLKSHPILFSLGPA